MWTTARPAGDSRVIVLLYNESPTWHVAFVCTLLSSLLADDASTTAPQRPSQRCLSACCDEQLQHGRLLPYLSSVLDRTDLDLQLSKKANLLLLENSFSSHESWQCGRSEKEEQKSNKPSGVRGFVKGKVCQRVFEHYNVVFPCLEFTQKTLIYQEFSDWTNT